MKVTYVEKSVNGRFAVCQMIASTDTPVAALDVNSLLFGNTAFKVPEHPTLKAVA